MKMFHSQCFGSRSNLSFEIQEDETNRVSVVFKGSDTSLLLETLQGWLQEIPEEIIMQWPAEVLKSDLSIIDHRGKKYWCWGPLSVVGYSRDSTLSVRIDGGSKQSDSEQYRKVRIQIMSNPEAQRMIRKGTAIRCNVQG
jgi:hypothetical protein